MERRVSVQRHRIGIRAKMEQGERGFVGVEENRQVQRSLTLHIRLVQRRVVHHQIGNDGVLRNDSTEKGHALFEYVDQCSAVSPSLFSASTSTPLSTKNFSTAYWFPFAAQCSAVLFHLSTALMLPPSET